MEAFEGCEKRGGICDCNGRPCVMDPREGLDLDAMIDLEIEECERLEEQARTQAALEEERATRDEELTNADR